MDTLFIMGKPELIMVIEDAATTDDPLENYLERAGWDLAEVKSLQESISEKCTVDIFTNDTRELSGAELDLQREIQAFLEGLPGRANHEG